MLDFSVPQFESSVKGKVNFLLPVNVTIICSENKETASVNQRVMVRRSGSEGNKKLKVEVRSIKYRQSVPQNLGGNGPRSFHQAVQSADVTLVTGLRLI